MPLIGHKGTIADIKGLCSRDALSHAYLFSGPAMAGKKAVALALARFLEKGEFGPPAGHEVLQDAELVDLARAKTLGAKDSIGIEAAREIKHFLFQKPVVSSRRTLVIDDAELLTTEAQNALLKIIEEPPVSSLIILIASDLEAILPTILSRLQIIRFGAVSQKEIAVWLEKSHGVAAIKAAAAAKKSFGLPGLAWRLLFDEALRARLDAAGAFLKSTPGPRRDLIKGLIAPDDFNLRAFLGAVVLVLAWDGPSARRTALWHKALALSDSAANFGVNPRLQLENLLSTSS